MNRDEINTFETAVRKKQPNKYGTKGHRYPTLAAKVCEEALKMFEWAPSDFDSRKKFFRHLLKEMGSSRYEIARSMGTNRAYHFGLSRGDLMTDLAIYTPFQGEYGHLGNALQKDFSTVMKTELGRVEDDRSSFTVTELTKKECEEKGYFAFDSKFFYAFMDEELKKANIVDKSGLGFSGSILWQGSKVDALMGNTDGTFIRAYKKAERENDEERYESGQFRGLFNYYNDRFKKHKIEGYQIGKVSYKFGETEVPITVFLIGLEKKKQLPPVVFHMDAKYFDLAIEEMSVLFAEMLSPMKEEAFIQKMAHFEYLFSYTALYLRGSASIREIITKALYKHQGYTLVEYGPDQTIDLYAFQYPIISTFIGKYPTFFERHPCSK